MLGCESGEKGRFKNGVKPRIKKGVLLGCDPFQKRSETIIESKRKK